MGQESDRGEIQNQIAVSGRSQLLTLQISNAIEVQSYEDIDFTEKRLIVFRPTRLRPVFSAIHLSAVGTGRRWLFGPLDSTCAVR